MSNTYETRITINGDLNTSPGAQDVFVNEPVAPDSQPVGLHLLPKDPKAPLPARLRCVVQQAINYAIACGLAPEDAAKFQNVFLGQDAPCALITPEIYIACVNESARQRDRWLGHTTGKLVVPAKGNRESYSIELLPLPEDQTQWVFVVGVVRDGGARQNGESEFMSHSLIFPQTKSKLALAVAHDLRREQGEDETGDIFQLVPSRRIYVNQVRNRTTGELVTVNRLSTLKFGTNLANLAAKAAYDAGFPFEKSRVNRMSASERRAAITRGRFGQLPGVQHSPSNRSQIETVDDPFAVAG